MLSNFSVLKNNALFPEGMKGRAANRVNNEQLKIYVLIIIQPLALRLCRHTAPGRTRLQGFRERSLFLKKLSPLKGNIAF